MQTNQEKLNFAFFGTPEVASETLKILKTNNFLPSLIVTTPDRPKGRKMLLTPSPTKIWAIENNIPFLQPEKLDQEFIDSLKSNHDLFIVVAYGNIMPEKLINLPELGSINIHYSLLPKYRGASPVESAILNGEKETGITIQQMAFEMDAGDILVQKRVEILPNEKTSSLRKRLIKIGAELLAENLQNIANKELKPIKQSGAEISHCKKIKKEDGLIDLNDNAEKNHRKFLAYDVWPRTFFFKDGKRFVITEAVIEDGNFVIKKVIPEGKKEVVWKND